MIYRVSVVGGRALLSTSSRHEWSCILNDGLYVSSTTSVFNVSIGSKHLKVVIWNLLTANTCGYQENDFLFWWLHSSPKTDWFDSNRFRRQNKSRCSAWFRSLFPSLSFILSLSLLASVLLSRWIDLIRGPWCSDHCIVIFFSLEWCFLLLLLLLFSLPKRRDCLIDATRRSTRLGKPPGPPKPAAVRPCVFPTKAQDKHSWRQRLASFFNYTGIVSCVLLLWSGAKWLFNVRSGPVLYCSSSPIWM